MLSKKILETIPYSIRTIRKLAGTYSGDLTFQKFRILTLVNEGMGQTQISHSSQVSMAAVSKMVDTLVKSKLLVREQGKDRRSFKLKLTKEGEKVRKNIHDQVGRDLDRNFKRLTKKEQEELNKGLLVLEKLMGLVNEK